MKETTGQVLRELWDNEPPQISLLMSLNLIGGEILLCLENCGSITARQITRQLQWPLDLVFMAIGALLREGLIHVSRRQGQIRLEAKATT